MLRTRLALSALIALTSLSARARADVVDPSHPLTIVVGPSRAIAPSERLDPARSGRTKTLLPTSLTARWERRVAPLDSLPVVTEMGSIIAISRASEAVCLTPDGDYAWRQSLGPNPPASPPLLLSDGTTVFVDASATLFGVSASGEVRFRTNLHEQPSIRGPAPLALTNGDFVVGIGYSVLRLGADGSVRARATLGAELEGEITPLSERSFALYAADGYRYIWEPPQQPRRLTTTQSTAGLAALVGDHTLAVAYERSRLTLIDLGDGATKASYPIAQIDGPVSVMSDGAMVFSTGDGWLLSLDARGVERRRVALDPGVRVPLVASSSSPGARSRSATDPANPPLIVDREGRAAFVRASGTVGVVAPGGVVTLSRSPACSSPLGIVPAGDRAVLVACADGSITKYGDR